MLAHIHEHLTVFLLAGPSLTRHGLQPGLGFLLDLLTELLGHEEVVHGPLVWRQVLAARTLRKVDVVIKLRRRVSNVRLSIISDGGAREGSLVGGGT